MKNDIDKLKSEFNSFSKTQDDIVLAKSDDGQLMFTTDDQIEICNDWHVLARLTEIDDDRKLTEIIKKESDGENIEKDN